MLLKVLVAFLFSSMLIRTRPEYPLLYSFSLRNETVNCLSYIISSVSTYFEQNETASSLCLALGLEFVLGNINLVLFCFSNWISAR